MMSRTARFVICVFVLLFSSAPAVSLETFVSEAACRLKGLDVPLRQTIILLDQAATEPNIRGDLSEQNRRWINAVVTMVGVQEGQRGTFSAPRERVTVLMALQDGADLIRLFSGCPPTFSPAEMEEMEKANSGFTGELKVWLGKNPKARVEADQKSFRTTVLGALVQVTRMPDFKRQSGSERNLTGSFLDALPAVARTFDVSHGIPRIIVISPMEFSQVKAFQDLKSARQAGFDLAGNIGADLQRAEVYITGMSRDSGRFAGEFSRTLFLGQRGRLVGSSGETLPPVDEAPNNLQVFGGFIDYGGVQAPMQIRFAVNQQGALVNSWVEITRDKAIATPLTGKALCKSDNALLCEVVGEGKEGAQIWVVDPGQTPKFDPQIPFSGLRNFEFKTSKEGVTGRFYDPIVTSINGKKELTFDLPRTPGVKF